MLEGTLIRISGALDGASIPYMLIGGYALAVHGIPRMTQDIDITLGVDIERLDEVIDATAMHGFKPIVEDPAGFALKTNVLLLEDVQTGIRVDLIFSFIAYERQAIERAKTVQLGKGESVKVAAIEDIVIYKLLAGRERDREDIATILNQQGDSLDLTAISSTVKTLSHILQDDSYTIWNLMIEKQR